MGGLLIVNSIRRKEGGVLRFDRQNVSASKQPDLKIDKQGLTMASSPASQAKRKTRAERCLALGAEVRAADFLEKKIED